MVESFPLSDANIFREYIMPALSSFAHDPDEIVRIEYAKNISSLAETARRFLEVAQYMKLSIFLKQTSALASKAESFGAKYD